MACGMYRGEHTLTHTQMSSVGFHPEFVGFHPEFVGFHPEFVGFHPEFVGFKI